MIALSVETTLERISPAAVFVPTRSGYTARSIARFRLPVWIAAVCFQQTTCQRLQFSYGVYPGYEQDDPEDWNIFARQCLQTHRIDGDLVILTEGPSSRRPETNHLMEIIDFRSKSKSG